MLTAICAVALTVMLNWQGGEDAAVAAPMQMPESEIIAPQHHHQQEAILTDASELYRICSSRPQRILPSQSSKTERTITPLGGNARRQNIVKPLFSHYDSRCRLEKAPFCVSASCDYYVIALRHIIR